MNFIVKNTVAPAGIIGHLHVQGLTEDVWGVSFTETPGVMHIKSGAWGTSEEEARLRLRNEIQKEVKKLSKNKDLRPSQSRRLDLLNQAILSV